MKSRNTGLLFNRFVLRAELIKKKEREREREWRGEGGMENQRRKRRRKKLAARRKISDSVNLVVVVRFEKLTSRRFDEIGLDERLMNIDKAHFARFAPSN